MSTRANVLIKDGSDELWFYRHSDGYPEGVLPTLKDFMGRVVTKNIRNNITQAAGWLIVIGRDEYSKGGYVSGASSWKVGAYEPTTGRHGDIEYLYILDLAAKKIKVYEVSFAANVGDRLTETVTEF